MRRIVPRPAAAGLIAVGAVASLLAAALPIPTARAAQAPGANNGAGYTVTVRVTFSGEAAPASGGGRYAVHPSCYWAPAPGRYDDPAAMLDWYLEVAGTGNTTGNVRDYGPVQAWQDAARRQAAGEKLAWYVVHCDDPADYADYGMGNYERTDGGLQNGLTFQNFLYKAFAVGDAIPPPRISSAELARVAREAIEIPLPAVDRNPKIGAAGGATLVGLPTWFWVEQPASVGGVNGDGQLAITASVDAVSATVTATTEELQLRSPAGAARCSPRTALVAYGSGAADGAACTVEFGRASTGGPYTVTSVTEWNATWTGSDGDAGELEPLQRTTTTLVPVAEVQNVVTR